MPTVTPTRKNKASVAIAETWDALEEGELKNPMIGAPTKYTALMDDKVYKLLTQGGKYLPMKAVIANLDISEDTFYKWIKDGRHNTFAESVKKGVAMQEARMCELMMDKSQATAGLIFIMKNSIHRYRDRIETENTNVNVDTVVSKQGEGVPKISWERKSNDMEVVDAEVIEE